jgi:hypothetical protein
VPWQLLFARALAAGLIVAPGARLFNCGPLDVGVCPGVELIAVEADALLSDRELADARTDGLVELIPAHAEIGWCFLRADEPRNKRGLSRPI